MMTSDQFGGLVRAILAAVGGWAVGKGYIDNATMVTVTGAAVTAGVAAWSYYTNKPGKVLGS